MAVFVRNGNDCRPWAASAVPLGPRKARSGTEPRPRLDRARGARPRASRLVQTQSVLAPALSTLVVSVENVARCVTPHAEVHGRVKSTRSIALKIWLTGLPMEEIHDRLGFRILVDDISECFAMLDALHERWEHVPGLRRNYVDHPKPNGYQSLHTTLVEPSGPRFEVQVRTREMHVSCVQGPAAHWRYKASLRGRAGSA